MRKFSLVLLFTGIVLATWVNSALAQISAGGTPPSFSLTLTSAVPTVQMAPVDAAAYLAEDEQAPKDEAYRFAAVLDVSLNLNNSGVWENVPGGRVWRLQILSPGAFSIGLIYDQWYFPEGAQLFIYSDDHSQVIGAFTSFNNWVDGTNVTHHVAGDVTILEVFEPAEAFGQSVLSILQVCHAYRNLFGRPDALDNFGDSGSCNNNVNCPEGANWQTNKRGVTLIVSGGSRLCTGSLVNNTNQDQVPYFLTANHCLGSSNSWVFVFNYESPGCPNVDGPTNQTVANSTLRANWSGSDFGLLQLSSSVPQSYNPYFNGWNRVDAASTSSVCIHHPSGDIKKITFDNNAPVSSTWSGTPANSHWRILNWEDGTTEPGSSGSPLFDQNHRITGQLHGGTASCANNIDDYYGKFSLSWTGNNSNSTRLSNWLDPGSTGVSTLDGLEGSASSSITVTAPNGGETWIEGTSQNITWTSVNVTGNVNLELNRNYSGGTWESIAANTANDGTHPWTVTLPASSAARVRITSVNNGAISDVSNANFTIAARTITVTSPNGGESWIEGTSQNVTWTSSNVTGNVNVDLNRTYPGGAWESIAANTANDGTQPWTVTLPASSTARVRVTSVSFPTVGDSSNANFTIAARTITVTSPNGGETWTEGTSQNVTWTSANVTGNVNVELNRNYSGGTWESIAANTANDGTQLWTVTLPASTLVRVRVTSVSFPTATDVSNNNFTIAAVNPPPVITHDPLDDQFTQPFSVTAIVTDNAAGVTTKLFSWPVSGGPVDSLLMNATGNPNEVAVTLGPLTVDSYGYYLRAVDAGALNTFTATYIFEVGAPCGTEYAYDDGTAEQSQWSTSNSEYRWAVKFDPPATPFALCSGRIGISALHPEASHSLLYVEVFAADGVGGAPGSLLFTDFVGSIGNVIGGVPVDPDNWATVLFRDVNGNPLSVNGSYYVAVSNPTSGQYEAFLLDQSSTYAGHSFVYDPCNDVWLAENSGDPSARLGNRMIRASGFPLTPPTVVIHRVGDNLQLDWQSTGAPYYRIFTDTTPNGAFATQIGSTTGTTFTDVNPLDTLLKFYRVTASTAP